MRAFALVCWLTFFASVIHAGQPARLWGDLYVGMAASETEAIIETRSQAPKLTSLDELQSGDFLRTGHALYKRRIFVVRLQFRASRLSGVRLSLAYPGADESALLDEVLSELRSEFGNETSSSVTKSPFRFEELTWLTGDKEVTLHYASNNGRTFLSVDFLDQRGEP